MSRRNSGYFVSHPVFIMLVRAKRGTKREGRACRVRRRMGNVMGLAVEIGRIGR